MTAPNQQAVGAGSETSCVWPTHVAGDYALVPVQHGGGTVTTPTGCSIVSGFPTATPSALSCFLRRATSNAEAALALAGGTDHMWGTIITVRNAHQVFPIHSVSLGARPAGASTVQSIPGAQPSIDDTLAIDVFAWNIDNAGPIGSGETNASLTSYAERYDAGTITNAGGGLWMGSGTLANAGVIVDSRLTTTSTSGLDAKVVFAPLADIALSGTVTISGSPAPNSSGGNPKVYLRDVTQPAASYLVLDAATETTEYSLISGGTGAFSFKVPYNDHVYQAVYADASGAIYGASAPVTFSGGAFPAANITISGGGGSGLTPPSIGPHFIR